MAEAQWLWIVFKDPEVQARFVQGMRDEGVSDFGCRTSTEIDKPVSICTTEGARGTDEWQRGRLSDFVKAVERRIGLTRDERTIYSGKDPERWHEEFPGYPGRQR